MTRLLIATIALIAGVAQPGQTQEPEEQKAVLITGASTGIGRIMGRTEGAIKLLYYRTLKSLRTDMLDPLAEDGNSPEANS